MKCLCEDLQEMFVTFAVWRARRSPPNVAVKIYRKCLCEDLQEMFVTVAVWRARRSPRTWQ